MATKKDTSGSNVADNGPDGLVVTDAEAAKARHEGAIEAVKESGKDARNALTDGSLPGDPALDPYHGSDENQLYADRLELGVDAFEKLVADTDKLTDVQVAGLLKLERNGQNRTPYVAALAKRLGIKDRDALFAVAKGGPDYTNDLTSISDLF